MRTNWECTPNTGPLVSTKSPGIVELLRRPDVMDFSLGALVEGLLYLEDVDPRRVALPALGRAPGSSWTR